jgi:hypothetical protein
MVRTALNCPQTRPAQLTERDEHAYQVRARTSARHSALPCAVPVGIPHIYGREEGAGGVMANIPFTQ